MNIRTIEDGFEYQAKSIFENLHEDYKAEMRGELDDDIITFADWLWNNRESLGGAFFERVDEYCGVDELVEDIEK